MFTTRSGILIRVRKAVTAICWANSRQFFVMRNMHRSDAPSVVAVNISGTEFQVARQVLLRHPDTFLHGLIYRRPDVEYIFIDGDAEIFSYILQFLRHGSVFGMCSI